MKARNDYEETGFDVFISGYSFSSKRLFWWNDEEPRADAPSMFVKVEGCGTFDIVYDRDTKVMYAVSPSDHNFGNVTMLVNADGTPKVWARR